MATLNAAVREAAKRHRRWMNGAVVVTDGHGDYEAIPGAYLSDISYTGMREVVTRIERGDTWGEDDPNNLTDADLDNIVAMVAESI